MDNEQMAAPEDTAVRVALWRALHLEKDSPPHVFEDDVGLKLAAPDDGWQNRPDMSPFTRPFRASIVARVRGFPSIAARRERTTGVSSGAVPPVTSLTMRASVSRWSGCTSMKKNDGAWRCCS